MMPVVLFDLDDTLLDHRLAVDTGIVAHLAASIPTADGRAEAARWHALEEEHYPRYLSGELDLFEQRRVRVRALVEPHGVDLATDDSADAWYNGYSHEYRAAWALHSDIVPCLDRLDALGIRVGVITNGDLVFQAEKIDRIGLGSRVEHLIASGERGYAKPDRRIFAHACAVFGVEPAKATYVGDRLYTDAIGAASAGLDGVWLDRAGAATAAELAEASTAVRVIRSLDSIYPA
jgi:putative hydrolase of the HAD superfamily